VVRTEEAGAHYAPGVTWFRVRSAEEFVVAITGEVPRLGLLATT